MIRFTIESVSIMHLNLASDNVKNFSTIIPYLIYVLYMKAESALDNILIRIQVWKKCVPLKAFIQLNDNIVVLYHLY